MLETKTLRRNSQPFLQYLFKSIIFQNAAGNVLYVSLYMTTYIWEKAKLEGKKTRSVAPRGWEHRDGVSTKGRKDIWGLRNYPMCWLWWWFSEHTHLPKLIELYKGELFCVSVKKHVAEKKWSVAPLLPSSQKGPQGACMIKSLFTMEKSQAKAWNFPVKCP